MNETLASVDRRGAHERGTRISADFFLEPIRFGTPLEERFNHYKVFASINKVVNLFRSASFQILCAEMVVGVLTKQGLWNAVTWI